MSWEAMKLGDVLPFKYGRNLPESKRTQTGEYDVVTSAGVAGSHCEALTTVPSVVVGRKGTIGKLTYCGAPVWPTDTAFFVEERDGVNLRFAYYLLSTLPFQSMNNDSAVPGLNRRDAEDLIVRIPSLQEQNSIADVLGALDDKIAANIRVKETCTELIKTIGSIPISNVPASELAVQIKKQISAGKLQDLDVRHYSIPAFDLGYASIESGAEIKSGKNLIEAPCVLVSKLNPRTPRIWNIPTVDSEETTVCSTEFIAWQGTTVPQAALYAALLQGSFSEQLQERASGTSNSHQRVRPQDMQEATIPDVRKLDQETLKLLEALNLQAADLIKENQVLAATRDELLPLLMNRKITVVEAEEAVGDVGVVKQKQQEEGDSDV